MSADYLAVYDSGPGSPVPGVQRPVDYHVSPLHSQPAFRHAHHGTGDLGAARCFLRPSTHDVNQLSRGIWRGWAVIPRPVVRGPIGHCTSSVSLPCSPLPGPFCDILGAPLPAVSIYRWGPGIGREQRRGPAGDHPPLRFLPAIWLRSHR